MKDQLPADIPDFEDIQDQFQCIKCKGTMYKILRKKRRVRNLIMSTVVCLKCGEQYGIPEEILD